MCVPPSCNVVTALDPHMTRLRLICVVSFFHVCVADHRGRPHPAPPLPPRARPALCHSFPVHVCHRGGTAG